MFSRIIIYEGEIHRQKLHVHSTTNFWVLLEMEYIELQTCTGLWQHTTCSQDFLVWPLLLLLLLLLLVVVVVVVVLLLLSSSSSSLDYYAVFWKNQVKLNPNVNAVKLSSEKEVLSHASVVSSGRLCGKITQQNSPRVFLCLTQSFSHGSCFWTIGLVQ